MGKVPGDPLGSARCWGWRRDSRTPRPRGTRHTWGSCREPLVWCFNRLGAVQPFDAAVGPAVTVGPVTAQSSCEGTPKGQNWPVAKALALRWRPDGFTEGFVATLALVTFLKNNQQ